MSGALGVYVSASVAVKAVGFLRTLAFVHLLAEAPREYNVWTIGLLVFTLAGTALCLGANQALTRYVSVVQARGELAVFLRRVAGPLAAVPVVLAVPVWLAAGEIASWLTSAGSAVTSADVRVVRLAVLNGVLLAMYLQVMGVLYGLRTYRLASVVELSGTVLFTVVAVVWLATTRRGEDLLWGHLACLAVSVAAGAWLTSRAARGEGVSPSCLAGVPPARGSETGLAFSSDQSSGTHNAGETPAPHVRASEFWGLLKFGLPALAGQLAWLGAPFVGYVVVNRRIGGDQAGVFASWMLLAQVAYFAANAAWQVVHSHAARQQEDDAEAAMARLRTSYKALALLWLAASVALYLAEPLWVHVLPAEYRPGRGLLGGLLMLYAAMTQMAILTMIARLMERPAVIAWSAAAGGAVSAVLAWWWTPAHGVGVEAAWAGGVGMLFGGSAAAAAWFALRRVRVGARIYVVLLSPAILLAGPWLSTVCLLVLAAVAIFTPAIFSREERQEIFRFFH